MAAEATTIINQNNLIEVIKSNAKVMDSVFLALNHLAKTCSVITKIDTNTIKKGIDNIRKIMPLLIDCVKDIIGGAASQFKSGMTALNNYSELFNGVQRTLNYISNIQTPKFLSFKLRKIKRIIFRLNDFMKELVEDQKMSDLIKNENSINGEFTEVIVSCFDGVANILRIVKDFKIPVLFKFKLKQIKKSVKAILDSIQQMISEIPTKTATSMGSRLKPIKVALETMQEIINISMKFLSFKQIIKLTFGSKKYIRRFRKVVSFINKLSFVISRITIHNPGRSVKGLLSLNTAIILLSFVLNNIRDVKCGLFTRLKIKRIIKAVKLLPSLIRTINRIKLARLLLTIKTVRQLNVLMRRLRTTMMIIATATPFAAVATVGALFMPLVMLSIRSVISIINKIRVRRSTVKKVRRIAAIVTTSIAIFAAVALATPFAAVAALGALFISLAMLSIKVVIGIINKIRVRRSTVKKVRRIAAIVTTSIVIFVAVVLATPFAAIAALGALFIALAMLSIKVVIGIINKIRVRRSTVKKIQRIAAIITTSIYIFIAIILAVPFAAVAAVAIWIVIGALYLIGLAMRILAKIVRRVAKGRVLLGLATLGLIIMELLIVSIALLMVGVIAAEVVKNALHILGLIGIIIGVILIMGVLAFVLGTIVLSLYPIFIIGFGAMLILIGSLFLIAYILNELTEIELDRAKIKEKIDVIIGTAFDVINALFQAVVDDPESGDKPWYTNVLNFLGGAVKTMITAIVSIALLAAIMVSIALISLIALQLNLLQKLDLNPSIIKANVKVVIDTARMIVDTIFAPADDPEEAKEKGTFRKILEALGAGPILDIITAILSIAFLAVIVVAIALITFIAAELRVLQMLNLDTARIKANVKVVIDTARDVINNIFASDDTEDSKEKSSFRKILEALGAGPILDIISAILAIAFLALIVVAITLVLFVAGQLKLLEMVEFDPAAIKNKVSDIISSARFVITEITAPAEEPKEKRGGFLRLLSWIFPTLGDILSIIASIGYLAMSMVAIGAVRKLGDEFMLFESPKYNNLESAINRCKLVLTETLYVINTIMGKQGTDIKENAEIVEDVVDIFVDVIDEAKSLAKEYNKFPTMSLNDVNQKASAIVAMCSIYTPLREQLNQYDKSINTKLDNFKTTVKKLEDIAKAYMSIFSGGVFKSDVTLESVKEGNVIITTILSLGTSMETILVGDYKKLNSKLESYKSVMRSIDDVIDEYKKIDDISKTRQDSITRSTQYILDYTNLVNQFDADKLLISIERLKMLYDIVVESNKLFKYVKDMQLVSVKLLKDLNETTSILLLLPTIITDHELDGKMNMDTIVSRTDSIYTSITQLHKIHTFLANFDLGLFSKTRAKELNEFAEIIILLPGIINDPKLTNIVKREIEDRLNAVYAALVGLKNNFDKFSEIVFIKKKSLEELLEITAILMTLPGVVYNKSMHDYPTVDNINGRKNVVDTALVGIGQLNNKFNALDLIEDSRMKSILNSTEKMISIPDAINKGIKVDQTTLLKRIEALNKLNDTLKEFGDMQPVQVKDKTTLLDAYGSFIEKASGKKIDLSKLQAAARIFESIAKLSNNINGNFDNLAEAINKNLAGVIADLNELLSSLPSTVTKASSGVKDALNKISNTVSSVEKSTQGINYTKYFQAIRDDVDALRDKLVDDTYKSSRTDLYANK